MVSDEAAARGDQGLQTYLGWLAVVRWTCSLTGSTWSTPSKRACRCPSSVQRKQSYNAGTKSHLHLVFCITLLYCMR